MIFKADFEKAFDSVRWDYLDGILSNFGFGAKWRGWIQGCLNSAKGSILVNGSPSSEFTFHKGLKQGDPLSPFLFILVMESLHISFNNILNARFFKGIRINESLILSHLFYADDAIFIGTWDKANVISMVHMLNCFFMASGLKINILKSKLMGIGTTQEEVNSAAKIIGCSTFSTPFKYLGVKVGSSSSRSKFWDEVISKVSSRLSKWKAKSLSIEGRFTLIKSVLTSLPLYFMSIYKAPMGVLHKLESIRRRFFNGVDNNERKINMIGWKKNLAAKRKGGLGVSSFFAYNRALLFKWVWRFRSDQISLWSRLIRAIHGDDIINTDPWFADSPLINSFPMLFALECNKNASVADKLHDISMSHSFRRSPRGGVEEEQYRSLVDKVNSVVLSNTSDRWVWSIDSSGDFSVKSARSLIDDFILPAVGSPTRWVKAVPIKINILAWKVCLDRLPTRLNLSLRGIDIPSISCPICSSAGETCAHLLFSCSMAKALYSKVARWCEMEIPFFDSYEDWLNWFVSLRFSKAFKDMLEGIFFVMWWEIWKFRNQILFGTNQPDGVYFR
ncbi:RNA-directed DNA polymerase, eukaryota [Tanacetum coccineum]